MASSLYTRNKTVVRTLPTHIIAPGRYNNFRPSAQIANAANFTSGTQAALETIYVPMAIPARFTVARFMICNGTSASGSFDIGLYDAGGNKLISTGNTSQTGTSQVQYVNVTDQSFPAGYYFLAYVFTGSGRIFTTSLSSAAYAVFMACTTETLASAVLPATMTPVQRVRADIQCFGFSQSDTI